MDKAWVWNENIPKERKEVVSRVRTVKKAETRDRERTTEVGKGKETLAVEAGDQRPFLHRRPSIRVLPLDFAGSTPKGSQNPEGQHCCSPDKGAYSLLNCKGFMVPQGKVA